VTGGLGEFYNGAIEYLYSLPNISRTITSAMKLAGFLARMEDIRNAYKIFNGKPEWMISRVRRNHGGVGEY
jgi:hypothetical protein